MYAVPLSEKNVIIRLSDRFVWHAAPVDLRPGPFRHVVWSAVRCSVWVFNETALSKRRWFELFDKVQEQWNAYCYVSHNKLVSRTISNLTIRQFCSLCFVVVNRFWFCGPWLNHARIVFLYFYKWAGCTQLTKFTTES